MTFDEYQDKAKTTAIYPNKNTVNGLMYTALGLAGEAGEIANKVKKVYRDELYYTISDVSVNSPSIKYSYELDIIDNLEKEIGDVLWYCAQICTELGINLGDAATSNLMKLEDRKERGVIGGSGDNR